MSHQKLGIYIVANICIHVSHIITKSIITNGSHISNVQHYNKHSLVTKSSHGNKSTHTLYCYPDTVIQRRISYWPAWWNEMKAITNKGIILLYER